MSLLRRAAPLASCQRDGARLGLDTERFQRHYVSTGSTRRSTINLAFDVRRRGDTSRSSQ